MPLDWGNYSSRSHVSNAPHVLEPSGCDNHPFLVRVSGLGMQAMALLHTTFEWLHNQETNQLDFPCQMQVYLNLLCVFQNYERT
jgi:hypothetical protein